MIGLTVPGFPNNIVTVLKEHFEAIDPDVPVLTRPIQKGDPIQCWGIVAALWTPDEESWEFRGGPVLSGPTINRYLIGVQCFNQDMDQERGLSVSARMAGIARNTLSRSTDVHVALGALTSTEQGFTERFRRSSVQGQRFLSNEIDGYFYHLSNLEFLVETEIM